MLVNLVRRSELICVYRAPDIHSFRSEVGAISSQRAWESVLMVLMDNQMYRHSVL